MHVGLLFIFGIYISIKETFLAVQFVTVHVTDSVFTCPFLPARSCTY